MTKFEEIARLKEDMRVILTTAKGEKRSLTTEEQAKFNDLQERKNQLTIDETLRGMENEAFQKATPNKRALFATAMYDVLHKRSLDKYDPRSVDYNGFALEQRNAEDIRTDSTGVAPMIPTVIGDSIPALEKGLIINKLGIKMQYGLVGNLSFPTLAAIEASIEGENTQVAATKLDIGNLKPNPYRIAISLPISNDAIDQTSDSVFNIAMEQLPLSTARMLNRIMFSTTRIAGATDGPFIKATVKSEYETEPTLEDIVGLETNVADKGVEVTDGTAAYVVSPKMYGKLKTTRIEKGSPDMVLKDGMMNGYPVLQTNYVAPDEIQFGVFSNCGIGQWGTIRVTVDSVSLASTNETKITQNSKYDIITARPEAFSVLKKKTSVLAAKAKA